MESIITKEFLMWKVNFLGVLAAAMAYMFIGFIFYSKYALGKFWRQLVSHMQKQADTLTTRVYFTSLASALVIAYIFGVFSNLIHANTIGSGILIGFLAWVGFVLPTSFSPVIFGKKPLAMFWLDSLFYLISYLAIGIITVYFA